MIAGFALERVVEVWDAERGTMGTGYLLTPYLILTALHTAGGPSRAPRIEVRPLDAPADRDRGRDRAVWQRAERLWPRGGRPEPDPEPEPDLALLHVARPGWSAPASPPPRWGVPTPAGPVECYAVGFPAFQTGPDDEADEAAEAEASAQVRDSKEVSGGLELGTGVKSELLTVHVRSSSVPGQRRGGPSWWSGFSGAALFCGGRLIGVITQVPGAPHGTDTLRAVRISELLADRGARELLEAEGLSAEAEALTGDGGTPADASSGAPHSAPRSGQLAVVRRIAPGGALPALAGRGAETEEALALLAPGDSGSGGGAEFPAATLLVTGMAGVGKSALAAHVARTAVRRGWFPGRAVSVGLRGYDTGALRPIGPEQLYRPLLLRLGMRGDEIDPTPDGQAAQYEEHLAELAERGRRVLLLLDDAAHADQVRELLPDGGFHRALITSRHALGSLPDFRRLRVSPLSEDDSVRMVRDRLRRADPDDARMERDPEGAARLAELCGRLPLALLLASGLLETDPGWEPSGLADALRERREELARLNFLENEDHGGAAVRTAFAVSFSRLGTADERLLFGLFPANPGPYLTPGAAAALTELEEAEARKVLGKLARAHLVEPSGEGTWSQHDLLREYAAGLHTPAPEVREAAFERLLEHFVRRADKADDALLGKDAAGGPDGFAHRGDAEGWFGTELPNLIAAAGQAAKTGWEWHATYLPIVLSTFLRRHGHLDEWIALGKSAVEVARGTEYGDPGKAAQRLASSLSILGLALGAAERFSEAVGPLTEACATYPPDSAPAPRALAWMRLSVALRRTGSGGEAAEAGREALEAARESEADDLVGDALKDLGLALADIGALGEAATVLDEAVALCRAADDRPELADALARRATVHQKAGEWSGAAAAFGEAVDLLRALGDQDRAASFSASLVDSLRRAGRHGEAGRLTPGLAQALRDPAGMSLATRLTIGDMFTQEGQHEQVTEVLSGQLAEVDRETAPREAARLLTRIGLTRVTAQDVDEGVASVRSALELWAEADDPAEAVSALTELAQALMALRRFEDAASFAREAVALCREKGLREPSAQPLLSLGFALGETGRFEEAVAAYEQAVEALPETPGRRAEMLITATGFALRRMRFHEERTGPGGQRVVAPRTWSGRRDEGELRLTTARGLIHYGESAQALTGLHIALEDFAATDAQELAEEARELIARAERDLAGRTDGADRAGALARALAGTAVRMFQRNRAEDFSPTRPDPADRPEPADWAEAADLARRTARRQVRRDSGEVPPEVADPVRNAAKNSPVQATRSPVGNGPGKEQVEQAAWIAENLPREERAGPLRDLAQQVRQLSGQLGEDPREVFGLADALRRIVRHQLEAGDPEGTLETATAAMALLQDADSTGWAARAIRGLARLGAVMLDNLGRHDEAAALRAEHGLPPEEAPAED